MLVSDHVGLVQRLEREIINERRRFPSLDDYDMMKITDELIDKYRAELNEFTPPASRLGIMHLHSYETLRNVCECHLDCRGESHTAPDALSIPQLLVCLNRIRNAMDHWSERGGYLKSLVATYGC